MTEVLCRILRGDPVDWPVDAAGVDRLQREAYEHGVHTLVAANLSGPHRADCPEWVRHPFARERVDEAAEEQLVRQSIRSVIAGCTEAGLAPLIFKGAALAFTHYADPSDRPYVDLDLLVRPAEAPRAALVLEALGYTAAVSVTGALLAEAPDAATIDRYAPSSQVPFTRRDARGTPLEVDLHWRPTIPQVLAQVFDQDDLHANAVAVPALGPGARAFGPVHALLLACLHRLAHHHGSDRLIWLYDLHLLGTRLTDREVAHLLHLARHHQVAALCLDGLVRAETAFGSAFPAALLDGLRDAAASGEEPSAMYLVSRLRQVDVLRADLAAQATLGARMRLLREHLFPPASYLRQRYDVQSPLWLPWLYLRRAVTGARRWMSLPPPS